MSTESVYRSIHPTMSGQETLLANWALQHQPSRPGNLRLNLTTSPLQGTKCHHDMLMLLLLLLLLPPFTKLAWRQKQPHALQKLPPLPSSSVSCLYVQNASIGFIQHSKTVSTTYMLWDFQATTIFTSDGCRPMHMVSRYVRVAGKKQVVAVTVDSVTACDCHCHHLGVKLALATLK